MPFVKVKVLLTLIKQLLVGLYRSTVCRLCSFVLKSTGGSHFYALANAALVYELSAFLGSPYKGFPRIRNKTVWLSLALPLIPKT